MFLGKSPSLITDTFDNDYSLILKNEEMINHAIKHKSYILTFNEEENKAILDIAKDYVAEIKRNKAKFEKERNLDNILKNITIGVLILSALMFVIAAPEVIMICAILLGLLNLYFFIKNSPVRNKMKSFEHEQEIKELKNKIINMKHYVKDKKTLDMLDILIESIEKNDSTPYFTNTWINTTSYQWTPKR